jgi:D-arabinan exo alpha-(1,3)/(1,5)-arabinofuranosidase (non-reducing end)
MKIFALIIFLFVAFANSFAQSPNNKSLFEFDNNGSTRWSSPENRNGTKGEGGKENNKAKGHPYDTIAAGQSYALLNVQSPGIINRIWITINDRSPEMLRSLKIEMFWDNETKPAVSVPFGDFFGLGLGEMVTYENALFTTGEGRSFVCFIPMPFKKAAKIVITNESGKTLRNIFFDVDYSLLKIWNDDYLYFHAYWHRDTATTPSQDFQLLPHVNGKGRFLGASIGINANLLYGTSWFGEGEVKIYLDRDQEYPTLNGTGTEDFIGSAWGQSKFINRYTGCTIASDSLMHYAFYRFHIPDPVYFKTGCMVALQQIGGAATDSVAAYQKNNAPLIVVSTDNGKLYPQYDKNHPLQLNNTLPRGWTNFYRSDDVCATAYFYLDTPSNILPTIQAIESRTYNLDNKR